MVAEKAATLNKKKMETILEEMMVRLSALKNEADEIAKLAKIMASKSIVGGEQMVEELEKEDLIRKAILELNDVYYYSSKGIRYLIKYSSDWIAVFRILADWGFFKECSFNKFEEMCFKINSELRYPVVSDKLRSGYYGLFKSPLSKKIILTDLHNKQGQIRRLTIAFEFENVFKAICKGEEPVVKEIIPVWESDDISEFRKFTERYKSKERSFFIGSK